MNSTQRLAPLLIAAWLPNLAFAGDVIVEATGMVVQANPSASSPFTSAQPGDSVTVHLEVNTPGMDIAPGQLTRYTLDLAASFVTIGATTDTFNSGSVSIQNNFPVADGIRMGGGPLAGGGSLTLDVSESSGTLFSSTDIAMQLGTYGPANWASFDFGLLGGGSFFEFTLPTVTISLPPIGTNFCFGQTPNSTGAIGHISASGSTAVSDNDFTLIATSLPVNQFGIFIVSRDQGFLTSPGSGILCLSGTIGRFIAPGQIQQSDMTGRFELAVDLNAIPEGGVLSSVVAGETWNFQTWHRDSISGGSGFTDGLEVLFN